jgi:hypothetical protein
VDCPVCVDMCRNACISARLRGSFQAAPPQAGPSSKIEGAGEGIGRPAATGAPIASGPSCRRDRRAAARAFLALQASNVHKGARRSSFGRARTKQMACPPQPPPQPHLNATTVASSSRALRQHAIWASHSPPSAAGRTRVTSAATGPPVASAASRARNSTTSSPRCSATAPRPTRTTTHASPEPRRGRLSWQGGRTYRASGGRRTSRAAGRACRPH